MQQVECLYDNDYRKEIAYNINDFPFKKLKSIVKGKEKYISLPGTFDIETSTIKDEYKSIKEDRECYQAFMYHWQMCVEGFVVFGRTWKELLIFLNDLKNEYCLNDKRKLVIYVHNLSYEFQFMYKFFKINSVFASDVHKVLKCVCNDVFEFRCSYYLSNMSLAKFIENTPNTHHKKGVGDLDFRKVYTTLDNLTPRQLGYCYNDVLGLYECIIEKLKEDSLTTIPLTSTGFVRRDCRNAMRKNKANRIKFEKSKLTLEQYQLLKDCFRGGNTASSRYMTNYIINDVSSYDISSSYPFVMLTEKFPIGKFMYYDFETIEDLEQYNKKYCTIGRYIFRNVRIKKGVPIPYLPIAKCQSIENVTNYNGRVLYADTVEIALTNIDYEIIKNQYDYDELYVSEFYFSRKDYLPEELRNVILNEYFYKKCLLKNVESKEYEYMKSKNKLNGIYGMSVTDMLHSTFNFNEENGEYEEEENTDLESFYTNRNNFLSYQWGVFVTAYARRNLQRAIDIVGLDTIYVDTDSVKFVGNHDVDFEKINNSIIEHNKNLHNKHYVTINDKIMYLGLFEKEPGYDKFITMGAKKYAFEKNGKIGVTVSGLNKKLGANELVEKGGLEFFKEGEIFHNSGRTVAQYNNECIHTINVKGDVIETASNIAIIPTTYTLGMTDTMKSILDTIEKIY